MFKEENPAKDIKTAETIIGSSVKVEGDFISNHDIIIEGEVIGNIKTKNNLKIGEGSKVKAEVHAKNAFIAGSIVGNITVEEKLHITSQASVKGNVSAKLLMVELGATLNGQCNVVEETAAKTTKESEENKK
ncbi:MAG: bactofilin family protein [Candidatus Komeilibacteria bacterium]